MNSLHQPSGMLLSDGHCSPVPPPLDHPRSSGLLSGLDGQQPSPPVALESHRSSYETLRPTSPHHRSVSHHSFHHLNEESQAALDGKMTLPLNARYELNPHINLSSRIPLETTACLTLGTSSRLTLESRLPIMIPRYANGADASLRDPRLHDQLYATEINLRSSTQVMSRPPSNSNLAILEESRALTGAHLADNRLVHVGSLMDNGRSLLDSNSGRSLLESNNGRSLSLVPVSETSGRDFGRHLSSDLENQVIMSHHSDLRVSLPIHGHQSGSRSYSENQAINLTMSESNMIENGFPIPSSHARVLQEASTGLHQSIPSLSLHDRALTRQVDERVAVSAQPRSPVHTSIPLLSHSDFLNSGGTISLSSYIARSPTHLSTTFIYPQILQQNSSHLHASAGDKTYEVLGQPRDYEEQGYKVLDQSRSSTDGKYFKRRLSSSRSLEEKSYEILRPVRQASDGTYDRRQIEDKFHYGRSSPRHMDPHSNHRIEKPIPIALASRHILDRKMLDIEMGDVSFRTDVIHYPIAASASSASSHGGRSDSSRSPISRRSSEDHSDHISVWRPY